VRTNVGETGWPKSTIVLGAVLLWLGVVAAYGPTFWNGWTTYDDPEYVTANAHVRGGLTLENIVWSLSTFHAANWHPLTWLSHQLDATLFGPDNATGPHAVNLLLHVLVATLVLWNLGRSTGDWPASLLASSLFALHPAHVECVAWISQRKSLLAMVFLFAALAAYTEAVQRSSWAWRGLSVVFFALSLTAKPMGVVFPALLLLWDCWPLARWKMGDVLGAVVDKWPEILLAGLSCFVTLQAQRSAMASPEVLSLGLRTTTALVAVPSYLQILFWPVGLVVFRPHPLQAAAWSAWMGSAALLIAITLTTLVLRRHRFLFVGWCWFFVALIPTLGLVQVGGHFTADRYLYLPSVGIALVVAWAGSAMNRRWTGNIRAMAAATFLAAVVLGVLTRHQTEIWRGTRTLFEHAVLWTEGNYVAHTQLAREAFDAGDMLRALEHMEEAYKAGYREATFLISLGTLRAAQEHWASARQAGEEALTRGGPRSAAYLLLSQIAWGERKPAEARRLVARALEVDPDDESARTFQKQLEGMAPRP
jgi:tetratricopeptide (TPR) repeat protein